MHVVLIPGERFALVYLCACFCFSNGTHYNWSKTENCHTYLSFLLICVHVVTVLQEAAFRKVVQTTMVRDRQHGPVIELNRIQVNTKFCYEKENLARS